MFLLFYNYNAVPHSSPIIFVKYIFVLTLSPHPYTYTRTPPTPIISDTKPLVGTGSSDSDRPAGYYTDHMLEKRQETGWEGGGGLGGS